MVNDQPLPTAKRGTGGVSAATGTRPRASLARLHSRALYRPAPPVECDDDGSPYRDGKPVESTLHDDLRSYARNALRVRYAARNDVFVASDLGLFFERGNRKALLAPDVLVSFGVAQKHKPSYKAWEEGTVPDYVLELLSPRTWRRDIVVKPPLYEAIGVAEYWIFDSVGKLPDPVVGRRLDAAGVYRPVGELPGGGYRSDVFGLDLIIHSDGLRFQDPEIVRGEGFRFRDPATGEILPDHVETVVQRQIAERERDEEAGARNARSRSATRKRRHAKSRSANATRKRLHAGPPRPGRGARRTVTAVVGAGNSPETGRNLGGVLQAAASATLSRPGSRSNPSTPLTRGRFGFDGGCEVIRCMPRG